jgi:exodeoxyribonuclease VII large subunit
VVIIRGGGAANDLAWLNNYELARCVCELDVPVLTGIGHERDSTILDEVAHQSYDTPSKVIAGIEGLIRQRAREARGHFDAIARGAERAIAVVRRAVDQNEAAVRSGAQLHVSRARQESQRAMSAVRLRAVQSVAEAAAASKAELGTVRESARSQLSKARAAVPALHQEVRSGAAQAVRLARTKADASVELVVERTAVATRTARDAAAAAVAEVGRSAKRVLRDSATSAEGLMREIAGQGPEKTLGRGFALVRTDSGATVSSASEVQEGQDLQISFHDGPVKARTVE